MRKGCLFLICTKVPYGLVVVLEMSLGKGQEHNLRTRLPLEGGCRKETPAVVRDWATVLSCLGVYPQTSSSPPGDLSALV